MFQLNQDLEQDETRSFRHNQAGSPIMNSPPGKSLPAGPIEVFSIFPFGSLVSLSSEV